MFKRLLFEQVQRFLRVFPAVAILGARQVGKTTLALEIAKHVPSLYLDLERDSDLAKLSEPALFLQRHSDKLVIIDEVQRLPELFTVLRPEIDARRLAGQQSGQFLILGSASRDLLAQSSESLAGRIGYLELNPFTIGEVGVEDVGNLSQLWLRGGFPRSYLESLDGNSLLYRQEFVRTYLERDIPMLGPRVPANLLKRLWTMLAHGQGGQLNLARLASSLGLSGKTVRHYLDILSDLFMVRQLPAWAGNIGKRLVKTPKVYVRDSGLCHALLGIEQLDDLMGHPVCGASWEGFVLENLIALASRHTTATYFRTSGGNEVDLVLEQGNRERWAIEIKRTAAPRLGKGLRRACEVLQPTRAFVVYAGSDRYPLAPSIEAIGVTEMIEQVSLLLRRSDCCK